MKERMNLSHTARPVDTVAHWKKEGCLLLSPPYQRGDVWGPIRQRNLIFSILAGIPIPSIVVNDRFVAEWGEEIAVIDGKQRMTAILAFLESRLPVPGEWFGVDAENVTFLHLPVADQRRFKMTPIQFCEGRLTSLEAERQVFELVNFGGVQQGQSDFAEEVAA